MVARETMKVARQTEKSDIELLGIGSLSVIGNSNDSSRGEQYGHIYIHIRNTIYIFFFFPFFLCYISLALQSEINI